MTQNNFQFGHDTLTVAKALELASGSLQGELSKTTRLKMQASCDAVAAIVDGETMVYSINTGFGALCNTKISKHDTKKLQDNILRSHSVGVGAPIAIETAKLMLILKLQSLSFGYSGLAVTTAERILWHIDNNLIPKVPCQGSVGASGDLAPLAHLFLPLIGLGEIWFEDRYQPSSVILQKFGKAPLELGPKEGLALINGTQFIAAFAVQVVAKFHNVLENADIIAALSLESLLGSARPFADKLHQLRPFPGALHVASRMRNLLQDSQLVTSHKNCARVQDPYSLRCIPQVHGASRDAWLHLKTQLHIELNAVTDNPIIFSKDDTISGGNFHGQPMALPLDYAAFAASEVGNISDRRTYLLLEGKVPALPLLLMQNTGLNSGFMIPQYTSAALASENKTLCFPASADSIPTSLGQEDHVSMGSISARKTFTILENLENILAVELLCAAQAFDFHRPLQSSKVLEACHHIVRKHITHADNDRVFADDLAIARQLIAEQTLTTTAAAIATKEGLDFANANAHVFNLN